MKNTEQLNNSLRFISDLNPSVSTVCFGLYFRVGSVNENENNCGISHLTEHMFFRRLNHMKNKELYYRMESIGGAIRGCTTRMYVFFELTVLSEYARAAFDLMNQFLCRFSWTEEEVDAERQIVLNEMAVVGNSTDALNAALTGDPSFLLSVKGTPDSLYEITAADVNAWKNRYFNCGNGCFIVTGNIGDVDLSDMKRMLQAHEASPVLPRVEIMPPTAFHRSAEEYLFCDGDKNFADVYIIFDLDLREIDWVTAMIIFDAFCNGDGSKLSFAMKEEQGMVYAVNSEIREYGSYGSLMISWCVLDEDLIESIELFFALLGEFKEGISAEELASSILFSTSNMKKYRDIPKELNGMYGYYDYIVDIPVSVEESAAMRDTVTARGINEVAAKIFDRKNMFVEVDSNREHVDVETVRKLFVQ